MSGRRREAAGRKKLAKRLVALLPPHKTYVEPFAGSAAVPRSGDRLGALYDKAAAWLSLEM